MADPRREAKRARSNEARIAREKAARKKKTTRTVALVTVAVVIFVTVGSVLQSGGDDTENASQSAPSTTTAAPAPTTCPAADGSSPRRIDFSGPPPNCIDPAKKYTATFDTSEGKVAVNLDTQRTPQTANNFVVLSRYHYYDNTTIHRTAPSIDIIQGGSPRTNDSSDPGPGYNIKDEGGSFTYKEGDLVMARTSGPDGAGAQYFFGTGPNVANLNGPDTGNGEGTYVVFGSTTEGTDVLKKILALHTGSPGNGEPSRPVAVKSVTITES